MPVISQRLLYRHFTFTRSLCVIAYSRVQPQTALITADQLPIYTPGEDKGKILSTRNLGQGWS